jgi:site-specific recombinase XerC
MNWILAAAGLTALTFAALTSACAAARRAAACCRHLAKIYDAAHPRAKRKEKPK